MGYADRDYHRQGPGHQGVRPPGRLSGAPVTKWLLISNAVIWLLDVMLQKEIQHGTQYEVVSSFLMEWGYFSIDTAIYKAQIWRLLSFQFLHADLMHVAFNMWGIFLFGPFLERWFRSKPFLCFYLLCGVAGALFYSLLVIVPGFLPGGSAEQGLVGASAGVFGILVGVALIAPDVRIQLLFPPIPMTMRTFALVFLGIEVFIVLTNSGGNVGGSAGHLGGALAGFLMLTIKPVRDWLSALGSGVKMVKPAQHRRTYEKKLRPKSSVTQEEATEVDRILDKINREGLHSLTDEERELLKKASGN